VQIIRVFPRKTNATPDDDLVRIGTEPTLFDEADEVHISCAFTWDMPLAEKLARAWSCVAPVNIGGPATGESAGEFVAGRYVKHGYTITSRGCGNGCWFCVERNRPVVELPIVDGYNVLDSNLLATSQQHQQNVFDMLARQKQPIEFTGGIEANRLTPWHIQQFSRLNVKQMFFAYDTPDDYEPLYYAGKMLDAIGVNYRTRKARCYVLCGYPKDSFEAAEKRMMDTVSAGYMPMAMLYRDKTGQRTSEWMKWQRQWARPAIISSTIKSRGSNESISS